jgi:hypothetical protein
MNTVHQSWLENTTVQLSTINRTKTVDECAAELKYSLGQAEIINWIT